MVLLSYTKKQYFSSSSSSLILIPLRKPLSTCLAIYIYFCMWKQYFYVTLLLIFFFFLALCIIHCRPARKNENSSLKNTSTHIHTYKYTMTCTRNATILIHKYPVLSIQLQHIFVRFTLCVYITKTMKNYLQLQYITVTFSSFFFF